jgi:sugar lactone lactonase YvrE
MPTFEVDTAWPQLPGSWVMASGLGLYADAQDHVWVSHRAELVTDEALAAVAEPPGIPAPLVMELDPQGTVVQSWGPHDQAAEWPTVLHGLFVDHNGFVWSNARDQHQIMKFTRDGERVLTLGIMGETRGSNDTETLGRPSDVYVAPETNELFVVDGYTNRRVIVFDAETGAYLRHWGAYGEPPDDEAARAEGDVSPSRHFATAHGITGSSDGLIYVADRSNSRVQVFRRSGEYVTERILRPGSGGAFSVRLSPDERFLYAADGTEHKIWILRRDGLEVLGSFGSEGAGPGQFQRPHNLAVDSEGNLYVGEADPGWRVQKFTFSGMAPVAGQP